MESSQQENEPATVTVTDLVEQLQTIYQQVLEKQKRELNELLNLQKLLNIMHSTTVIREDPNNKNVPKETKQEKKQFNLQRIGQKMQELIEDTEQVVIVQNTVDTKKPVVVQVTKPKKQTKKPQPVVEKKPPLPTVNRSNDPSLRTLNPTKYVPPRNKNEVTGKVTANKIMTQDKVFRPQLKTTAVSSKQISSSVQKRSSVSTTSTFQQKQLPSTSSSSSLVSNQKNPHMDVDENSISEYKNMRANAKTNRLKQFSKPIDELCNEITKKKQNAKKKFSFKQLIEKYENEEMGHRGMEEKRRVQFIKKLNSFALSVNQSNCNEVTNSIPKRVWKQYPYIFQFNQLLESLEQGIAAIQQQDKNDLRVDPKEAYRLQVKIKLIETQLDKIRSSTQIEVPQKLDLSFKSLVTMVRKQMKSMEQGLEDGRMERFYEKMMGLLRGIQDNETLGTKELSLLRVITEIGLHDGKKTPLIMKTDEFEEWKQAYSDVDDRTEPVE